MEKLIELLNEYRPAEENCSYELYDKWVDTKNQTPQIWYVENTYADGSVRENQTLYFISKKGGFIKRLVDNDKIDKSKVFSFIDTDDKPYEDILCLLALSDEPVTDLISYLK